LTTFSTLHKYFVIRRKGKPQLIVQHETLNSGLAFEKKIRFMLFEIKTLYNFCVFRYLELKRYSTFAFKLYSEIKRNPSLAFIVIQN